MDTKKRIAFDLDGTLTKHGLFPEIWDTTSKEMWDLYDKVEPNLEMIELVNKLYEKGYVIYIFTSRNNMFQKQIKKWLEKYNVKHDYFITDKPFYDYIVDDKAIRPEELKEFLNKL